METIYRLKKRMVYPEKLTKDNAIKNPSSSSSWCGESLETVTYASCVENVAAENGNSMSRSSQHDSRPNSSNTRYFIHERVRHLVDAFSNRTIAIRRRIELPPTPSSLSSLEEVDNNPSALPSLFCRPPSGGAAIGKDNDEEEFKSRGFFGKCSSVLCGANSAVIDPQGLPCMIWLAIAALAYLYNCWTVPLRATFPYQTPTNRAIWMFFDYLCDIIYIIDIAIVQPRIMYIADGFWVTAINLTRKNYIQSTYFKRDIASLLPLDILYFYFGPDAVYLRTPRLLKLHTFWTFFENVDRILASPHVVRILRTLLYMMYMIHINACGYYAFSSWEGLGSNDFVFNGKGNAYIVCFYFATKTATSIGKNPKPKRNIELMFMTFSWLLGVFVFALLIGQIRDIIATATRSQTEYRKLVDDTLEYLRRLNMPPDLMKRVQMWFSFTWKTQHTLDENRIMDCLPHKMKTDIAINVHIAILNKVTLFADCDEALLRELVLKLRSVIYLPGDLVCRRGDVGHEMYILQSGQIEVLAADNTVLATLSEGSVFGEISLLGISGLNRRTADVRSKGYTNLFVLHKFDLKEALIHYPDAQEILNKKAKALMRKNASLERAKNKPVIVIDNPRAPAEERLLAAVMQAVPDDSDAKKLLKYGSRKRPRNSKRNPTIKNASKDEETINISDEEMKKENIEIKEVNEKISANKIFDNQEEIETSFQCDVIVHREMS